MTASNTGSWVRRVGAAGGGRTYRRRRPINYYGALGLILVLGVFSVGFARYDYRKGPPTLPAPAVVALGISTCGTQVPSLAPDPSSSLLGYQMLEHGVLEVAPVTFAQAGDLTLASFVKSYTGLSATKAQLIVPVGTKGHKARHVTGKVCPKGTKDHGKVGHVEFAVWSGVGVTTPSLLTTNPAKVSLSNGELVTIGFVPDGVTPPQPPASVIGAMENQKTYLGQHGTVSTTTTTIKLPPTTTTTVHRGGGTTTTTVKKSTKG